MGSGILRDVRIGGVPLPPSVHLEATTTEDVIRTGDVFATWADDARRRLLEPLRENLASRMSSVHVTVDGERLDQSALGSDAAQAQWSSALQQLARGEVQRLSYVLQPRERDGTPTIRLGQARLQVLALAPEFGVDAATVAITVSRGLYDGPLDEETQSAWVEAATQAAVQLRATTGYVTIDYVAGASPYEQMLGRDWLDGVAESRRLLRGFYWGNLLSAEHIAALGGVDRVLAEAPCALAENLSAPAHESVYLQLTPAIEVVPDGALLALERYLRPALPAPADRAGQEERLPRTTGATPATLTFKHEDETQQGEAIGPAVLVLGERGEDVRDLGWMTLSDAADLARTHGYEFAED
jgi:hypothetical protein